MNFNEYLTYVLITSWIVAGFCFIISYSYGNDQPFKIRLKEATKDGLRVGMYALIGTNFVIGPILIWLKYF